MYWLFNVLHKVCVPVSILGIILYYASNLPFAVYICAGILIVHSLLNCKYGGQNNLVTEVATFFVGGLIAVFFKIDFWPCVAVSYCYAEIFFTIPGIFIMGKYLLPHNKEKQSKEESKKPSTPNNSVTYEVDKKYISCLMENCPEITQREAELFCDVLVENAKNGKAAALRAFNDFAQNQVGDDPIHALCVISFLSGALVPNKVVSKEESDSISKYYRELYLSKLSQPNS